MYITWFTDYNKNMTQFKTSFNVRTEIITAVDIITGDERRQPNMNGHK